MSFFAAFAPLREIFSHKGAKIAEIFTKIK